MRNRKQQTPKSEAAQDRSARHDFPEARPIFWGPNQFTKYPDEYEEPSDWHQNEVLRIPRVVRLFNARHSAAVVYLGKRNWITAWEFAIFEGNAGPFVGVLNTYAYNYGFETVNEIANPPYNANMTSHDVFSQFSSDSSRPEPTVILTGAELAANHPLDWPLDVVYGEEETKYCQHFVLLSRGERGPDQENFLGITPVFDTRIDPGWDTDPPDVSTPDEFFEYFAQFGGPHVVTLEMDNDV